MPGNRMMGFGMMGGPMIFWAIVWIAFLALLIVGVVWAVRGLRGGFQGRYHPSKKSDEEEALRILKGRYARGEIDRDEYEKMKKDLAA